MHKNVQSLSKSILIYIRDQYVEDQLPAHPCLELIANSEQILSNYTSRRLLTYKKVKEPEVDMCIFNVHISH